MDDALVTEGEGNVDVADESEVRGVGALGREQLVQGVLSLWHGLRWWHSERGVLIRWLAARKGAGHRSLLSRHCGRRRPGVRHEAHYIIPFIHYQVPPYPPPQQSAVRTAVAARAAPCSSPQALPPSPGPTQPAPPSGTQPA